MYRVAIGFAAVAAALAVASAPALGSSDPVTEVRAAAARLTASVHAAQAILTPDLQALRSDVQRRDAAGVKRDLAKIKADTQHVLPPVDRNRKTLLADVEAARAVGINIPAILPGGVTSSSGPLAEARALETQLRKGMAASHSVTAKTATTAKPKTTKAKTAQATKVSKPKHVHAAQKAATTKQRHVHAAMRPPKQRHVHAGQHAHAKKPPFVKHHVRKHPHTGKHPHPHK